MQPPPNPSAMAGAAGGALGRRKLRAPLMAGGVEGAMSGAGGSGPAAAPDASRVAAKLPGLKGFRLGGMPGRGAATPAGSAPPVGSEAAIRDFAAQNPGLTEDFIRNAAGGGAPDMPTTAPPQQVQGRALNADGTSVTGRGGNVQQLGAAAMRRLGSSGAPGGSDADMVTKRLPPGLKGFRMAPGVDPNMIGGGPLPGGPREPDFLMNPPPTDEITREVDAAGPKAMVADEPPMEFAPPRRRPPGGRMLGPTFGGRSQDY